MINLWHSLYFTLVFTGHYRGTPLDTIITCHVTLWWWFITRNEFIEVVLRRGAFPIPGLLPSFSFYHLFLSFLPTNCISPDLNLFCTLSPHEHESIIYSTISWRHTGPSCCPWHQVFLILYVFLSQAFQIILTKLDNFSLKKEWFIHYVWKKVITFIPKKCGNALKHQVSSRV